MTTTAPEPDPLEALKAASTTAEEAVRAMAAMASAVTAVGVSFRELRTMDLSPLHHHQGSETAAIDSRDNGGQENER